jgi:hypothetical protein
MNSVLNAAGFASALSAHGEPNADADANINGNTIQTLPLLPLKHNT